MSSYIKSTDFAAKDALLTGNPLKIVSGTEIDDEFNAIQTAVNTKADTNSPTLTGVPLAPTAVTGTSTTQIASTAFVQQEITALGLGDMSTQDASAVAITGGDVSGVTGDGNTFTNFTFTTGSIGTAVTGVTQSVGDSSTKLATTAFVGSQINAARGYIAFNGATGATIASKNLSLSKAATGVYNITCDSTIRDGTSNWAVTVGNVDEGTLSQSDAITTADKTLKLYNAFVSSRTTTGFTVSAKYVFNNYQVFSAADTDGNATQMFGIAAIDPTYVVVTLF